MGGIARWIQPANVSGLWCVFVPVRCWAEELHRISRQYYELTVRHGDYAQFLPEGSGRDVVRGGVTYRDVVRGTSGKSSMRITERDAAGELHDRDVGCFVHGGWFFHPLPHGCCMRQVRSNCTFSEMVQFIPRVTSVPATIFTGGRRGSGCHVRENARMTKAVAHNLSEEELAQSSPASGEVEMLDGATCAASSPDTFFAIPPIMLPRNMRGPFSVYLCQNGEYILYARAGEMLGERHRHVLTATGVDCVYVEEGHRLKYRQHVTQHLGSVLADESIPLPMRAQVFYEASCEVAEEVFTRKLPPTVDRGTFDRIFEFVTKGVSFLTLENSIRTMASLIAHDYHTFSHSVHVFIYSQIILQSYGFDDRSLVQFGLGAMLHDIGKMFIDESVLNKPGPLTWEEREVVNEHPVLGAGACTRMPLSQDALHCILFHHEKLDGTGYPCGLKGEAIPLPVRAVTIADIYDALCSHRPYARARNAFQVLRTMKDEMSNELDMDVFSRFVRVLSGAQAV